MKSEAIQMIKMIYGKLRGLAGALNEYNVPLGTVKIYIESVKNISNLLDETDRWELNGLQVEEGEMDSHGVIPTYIFKPKLHALISWLEIKFGFVEKATSLGSLINEIRDDSLKTRSIEILATSGHFDIPISQATLVLEDRIRKRSKYEGKKSGVELVNEVIKPEPSQTTIKTSDDPAVQAGFANMCRGVMQFYRNETHHHLIEISKEDAIKIVAFIDLLLKILSETEIRVVK